MTSRVSVNAHLVNTKQVQITIRNKATGEILEEKVLQDGESCALNVFDEREIIVSEVYK